MFVFEFYVLIGIFGNWKKFRKEECKWREYLRWGFEGIALGLEDFIDRSVFFRVEEIGLGRVICYIYF